MARIDAMDQVEDGGSRTAAAAASGGGVGGRIEGGGGGGGRTKLERLPCPRCESTDTKFCYYNNYNLQQPRHFCKGCRRYWTRGGALRNVPVGGGTRKATPAGRRKRASSSYQAAAPAPAAAAPVPLSVSAPLPQPLLLPPPPPYELSFVPALAAMDPDRRLLDLGGSFSSLLAPAPLHSGHFPTGYVLGGAGAGQIPTPAPPQPPVSQAQPEGFWGMGWPDLSI